MSPSSTDQPPWDDDFARRLVGRIVLIGITQEDHRGKVIAQHQMHGKVASASRENGIEIALEGVRSGETYRLPPTTAAFRPASPGEYRLRQTGEVVIDPDYTSVWTVTSPPPGSVT
jgi:hypothetical protein